MEENMEVELEVSNLNEYTAKAKELIGLLQEAKTLLNELASCKLEIEIKS